MSLEIMLKTLVLIGFFQTDAEVYLHLLIQGPKTARDIAEALKMTKHQVYHSLVKLREKKIVNASSGRPSQFTATSFEEVLDIFKEASFNAAQNIAQNKDKILSIWQSIVTES